MVSTARVSKLLLAPLLVTLCGALQGCAGAGKAAESTQQAARCASMVVVPMACHAAADAARDPARAPLGLAIGGLSPAQGREAGIGDRGAVMVLGVAEGGRAAAAGLPGGDIVLAVQGRDVADPAALEELLRSLPPGASVNLRVWRRGGLLELVLETAQPAPGTPGTP